MTDRILVRVDYDGTHDGTWIGCAPYEPPVEYTGSEPQYILSTPLREAAPDLLEALDQIVIEYDCVDLAYDEPASLTDAVNEARKVIAKARGQS